MATRRALGTIMERRVADMKVDVLERDDFPGRQAIAIVSDGEPLLLLSVGSARKLVSDIMSALKGETI